MRVFQNESKAHEICLRIYMKICIYSSPEKFYILHVDSFRNVNSCFNCMFNIRCTFHFSVTKYGLFLLMSHQLLMDF